PAADANCVALAVTGPCRPQLPLKVMLYECPLADDGGAKSTLPNTDPLSLTRFCRNGRALVGTPRSARMSTNRETESDATPAVCRPRGPVLRSVWLSRDCLPS